MSPAVIVPSLLNLSDRGYGLNKGVPTLVIAAASVDDVLAITGHGVAVGIAFSSGSIGLSLVKGPLEAILGVVYGVVIGVVLWYFPTKQTVGSFQTMKTVDIFTKLLRNNFVFIFFLYWV